MTTTPTTQDRIRAKCQALADFLVEKNQAYGDSALHPIGLFARGRASDLIRVRIDDKLNRIRNRPDAFGEDAVQDLLGYLVLFQIATDIEREQAQGQKLVIEGQSLDAAQTFQELAEDIKQHLAKREDTQTFQELAEDIKQHLARKAYRVNSNYTQGNK
jgi:hypothetical protein